MKKYYLTTTLPYVNSDPHIGFALEIIQADALVRFKRMQGYQVCFNTGTDEHGLKIYRKAQEEKKDPQEYCDEYAAKFNNLKELLHLSYTNFIRTTDPSHITAAQEFWRRCDERGDIYKKKYWTKYCVGCELEKTNSELDEGKCPIHPKLQIEVIEEENYFFRFSRYQQKLLELYDKNKHFVVPATRLNEIREFVKNGLQDFSISRLKSKMPWGVPVPNDSDHVMYVWFDALINYISTIGWPTDEKSFKSWWPVVQVAGKDNLRQQSAIWQAMLLSAGLSNSAQIFIHGFITSDGQKMSKSLGNVVNPIEIVNKYGVDALRYYLLREIPSHGDGDFSEKRFTELYNADLANGLGNLVQRVATLCKSQIFTSVKPSVFSPDYQKNMDGFQFDGVLQLVWERVRNLDRYINETVPWKVKDQQKLKIILQKAVDGLRQIGYELMPMLPETGEKIVKQFSGKTIPVEKPYFMRI